MILFNEYKDGHVKKKKKKKKKSISALSKPLSPSSGCIPQRDYNRLPMASVSFTFNRLFTIYYEFKILKLKYFSIYLH